MVICDTGIVLVPKVESGVAVTLESDVISLAPEKSTTLP